MFSNDGVGVQHYKQLPERRLQVVVRPLNQPCTVAAGQVVVEKPSDESFVNPMNVQPAPDCPARNVCHAYHVVTEGAGCIPALR